MGLLKEIVLLDEYVGGRGGIFISTVFTRKGRHTKVFLSGRTTKQKTLLSSSINGENSPGSMDQGAKP